MLSEDPKELNWNADLEMQKRNIPTVRAKREDEKNGVICQVIKFTLRVTIIKMSQLPIFLYFLLMTAKNESQFEPNI